MERGAVDKDTTDGSVHLKRFALLLRIALYSSSRIAVNLSSVLVSIIVLRFLPVETSHIFVLALTVCAFLANCFASWKEQVLYRFFSKSLTRNLRPWFIAEFAILFAGLTIARHFHVLGRFSELSHVPVLTIALLSVCDAGYRTAVVSLQMSGRDRLFILMNYARAGGEAITAIVAIKCNLDILQAIAATRLCFWLMGSYCEWSSQLHGGIAQINEAHRGWPRYARLIFVWMILIQLIQYFPQLALTRAHMSDTDKHLFASYRLFNQAILMGSSLLMLYVHPKLFQTLHQGNLGSFYTAWQRWFITYNLSTLLLLGGISIVFPLFISVVLSSRYTYDFGSFLLAVPGIVCLAVANYIQKLAEVGEKLQWTVIPLGIATCVMMASLYVAQASSINFESLVAKVGLSLTMSQSFYLAAVSWLTLRRAPVPWGVLKYTKLVAISATAVFVIATLTFAVKCEFSLTMGNLLFCTRR